MLMYVHCYIFVCCSLLHSQSTLTCSCSSSASSSLALSSSISSKNSLRASCENSALIALNSDDNSSDDGSAPFASAKAAHTSSTNASLDLRPNCAHYPTQNPFDCDIPSMSHPLLPIHLLIHPLLLPLGHCHPPLPLLPQMQNQQTVQTLLQSPHRQIRSDISC